MFNKKGEDITNLCIENYALLKSVVCRYASSNGFLDRDLYDDMLSFCTISYINACIDYNEKLGYKFSTFATKYIENKIKNYFHLKNAKKRNFKGCILSFDEKCLEEKDRGITYAEVIPDKKTSYKYNIILNEIQDYVFNSGEFDEVEIEYFKLIINGKSLQSLLKKLNYKSYSKLTRYIKTFHKKINKQFNPNGELMEQFKL